MTDIAADHRADLRERLVKMREDLIESLATAPHLDAGWLTLLGAVGSALAAIDGASGKARP